MNMYNNLFISIFKSFVYQILFLMIQHSYLYFVFIVFEAFPLLVRSFLLMLIVADFLPGPSKAKFGIEPGIRRGSPKVMYVLRFLSLTNFATFAAFCQSFHLNSRLTGHFSDQV